jgi:hypothetical protein
MEEGILLGGATITFYGGPAWIGVGVGGGRCLHSYLSRNLGSEFVLDWPWLPKKQAFSSVPVRLGTATKARNGDLGAKGIELGTQSTHVNHLPTVRSPSLRPTSAEKSHIHRSSPPCPSTRPPETPASTFACSDDIPVPPDHGPPSEKNLKTRGPAPWGSTAPLSVAVESPSRPPRCHRSAMPAFACNRLAPGARARAPPGRHGDTPGPASGYILNRTRTSLKGGLDPPLPAAPFLPSGHGRGDQSCSRW